MLTIYINESGYRYETEELIKLFVPPSGFTFIEDPLLSISDTHFSASANRSDDDELMQEDHNSVIYRFPLLSIKLIHIDNYVYLTLDLVNEGQIIRTVSTPEILENNKDCSKKEIKDAVKRAVFLILADYYKYRPPWGILTGVRPTKIVNEYIENGMGEEDIIKKLKYYYYIEDEKINLLLKVCRNERKILGNTSTDEVSVYIGVPFCPSRCIYCSFASYPSEEKNMDIYLEAISKEIQFVGNMLSENGSKIETLYIGGGTPTALTESQLSRLLSCIQNNFDLKSLKEYTIEAGRPDTLTKEKLNIMKNKGVNRISINPQTMKDETLKLIGRKHSSKEIVDMIYLARECGMDNINMDLIAGLPEETPEDFKSSLDILLELKPENITVHTLALKRASKLKEIREEYNYEAENAVVEMLKISRELLESKGYTPYYMYRQKYMFGNHENVGYSKQDRFCIYNVRIMEEKQTIIALGAGGISKIYYPSENRLERVPNVSNYEVYIDRIDEMLDRKRKLVFANIDNKIKNTL